MVDRILHIGYKLSGTYNKELLQRAAEVYIYKGRSAVVPHLTTKEAMPPAEAETLAEKIDIEVRKVNRQVLLQYAVIAIIFITFMLAGFFSRSYIFAGIFAIPALLVLYSLYKFVRRNTL
jgi:hypothetical protein